MAAGAAKINHPGKERMPLKSFIKRHWVGYAFLLPFALLFFVFTIIPVFVAIFTSMTNSNMLQRAEWVGFNNYKLLFVDDEIFTIAIKNTMYFAFITGPLGYMLSFMAAWVINRLAFKRWFALAFYAPSILSAVAMTNVWMVLFAGDRFGWINNFLLNIGVITSPILWNADPQYIMTVVIIISFWMSMGNGFLVFLAGFQNINPEYYEAGEIDGIKTRFQQLFYLTLPMMKPQLLFGAINTITMSFAVFDIARQVTAPLFPSPNYSAHTIVAHLYDYAFIRFQMGYASAISVVLFAITFVLGRIVLRALRSDE